MNSCNRCNPRTGIWVALIASVIIGIVAGYVFSLGLLTGVISVTARIALRLAVLAIAFVLAGLVLCGFIWTSQIRECFIHGTSGLLVGGFGTIVVATILMSLSAAIGVTITAIIVGLGAFFAALMVVALINLIRCLICELRFRA